MLLIIKTTLRLSSFDKDKEQVTLTNILAVELRALLGLQ